MRRWGFWVAAAILTSMSLTLPFLYLYEEDTYSPLGFEAQVWVRDAGPAAATTDLSKAIESFAETRHVNVARHRASTDDAFFGRELYVAVGDSNRGAGTWIKDGYPYFSRLARTEVHQWNALDLNEIDPRGFYLVDASPEVAGELATEFSERGFTAATYPYLGPSEYLEGLLTDSNITSGAIAVLAAIVLVGAAVLLNAKSYGVGRLHGRSLGWLVRRDVVVGAPGVLLIALILSAAAMLGLGLYNHLHYIDTYCALSATLLLVSAVATFTTHVAAIWLTSRIDTVSAIKGQLPVWPTLTVAYLLRLPAALLAVASAVAALALAAPARQAVEGLAAAQAHAGDASYMLLNGSLDAADLTTPEITEWFTRADRDGRILLAEDSSSAYRAVGTAGVANGQTGSAPDVLTVNDTYLAEQVVLAENGSRITPDDLPSDRATLLVPAVSLVDGDAVLAQAVDELEFARSRSGIPAVHSPTRRTIASGQQLFTYGSALGSRRISNPATAFPQPS